LKKQTPLSGGRNGLKGSGHSGIDFVTPEQCHNGLRQSIVARRKEKLKQQSKGIKTGFKKGGLASRKK